MSVMSSPNTAQVFFNPVTGNVWLDQDGVTRELGAATTMTTALAVIATAGLIRTGNWLPAYGPVRSATVWTEVPA